MPLGGTRPFPGSGRVLLAQAAALPQPDQLCGPFAGHAALHAVVRRVPAMLDLARSARTEVWAEDDGSSLPPGAASDRTGWDRLPRALTAELAGTSATGLTAALELAGAAVTPARVGGAGPESGLAGGLDVEGRVAGLLEEVSRSPFPLAVVANLHTGPVQPPGLTGWEVGHFVVLWGLAEQAGRRYVGIADSYPELGQEGQPSGCRFVDTAALTAALSAPPGRGLLLLSRPGERVDVQTLVTDAGLVVGGWD